MAKITVVTNTSPISWLERVGRLDLLISVYDEIYAPPLVFNQLEPHYPTRDFVSQYLGPVVLSGRETTRFSELVDKWFHRLNLDDKGEIEVFVAYRYFLDVDEMLFANKDAERTFRHYGNVRDIVDLYKLAERKNIFSREDSKQYIDDLLRFGYRRKDLFKIKEELSSTS